MTHQAISHQKAKSARESLVTVGAVHLVDRAERSGFGEVAAPPDPLVIAVRISVQIDALGIGLQKHLVPVQREAGRADATRIASDLRAVAMMVSLVSRQRRQAQHDVASLAMSIRHHDGGQGRAVVDVVHLHAQCVAQRHLLHGRPAARATPVLHLRRAGPRGLGARGWEEEQASREAGPCPRPHRQNFASNRTDS